MGTHHGKNPLFGHSSHERRDPRCVKPTSPRATRRLRPGLAPPYNLVLVGGPEQTPHVRRNDSVPHSELLSAGARAAAQGCVRAVCACVRLHLIACAGWRP